MGFYVFKSNNNFVQTVIRTPSCPARVFSPPIGGGPLGPPIPDLTAIPPTPTATATAQPPALVSFLTDHLGSTSMTTDSTGAKLAEMRYRPCPLRYTLGVLREGEPRYTSGTSLPK